MGKKLSIFAMIVLLLHMLTPASYIPTKAIEGTTEEAVEDNIISEEEDIVELGEDAETDINEETSGVEDEAEEGNEEPSQDEEEAQTNDEVTEENDGTNEEIQTKSKNVTKNAGLQLLATESKDLGNIFEFESFQKDKVDVENNEEIEFNTQYQLQYNWDTEDLDVKAGDIATLQLPDVFKHWTNAPDQDIVAGGIVVGTYSINNGVLTFVFNENIEGAAVQNGFVGLNLEFNEEKFLEEWEQEIDFDGDGEKDLTVIVIPGEVETRLDKEGHTDSDRDAREITWVVDFTNGSDEDIANGILTDSLPEGLGEARGFVVKELSFDFDGNKIVGEEVSFNEPTVDGNEFELTFDNVPARGGYRVEYTTTITDYTETEFTNKALFTYGDEELDAYTTVYSGERSNPIQKEGTYNWNTGKIDWTIIVNENGMDIENAIVHDELPEEQTLVPDSIEVTKNWQETNIEADGFPITLGSVSSDEVYRINFSTDIDWSKVNGGEYQHYNEFMNETKLTDGENPIGEDDAKVEHLRSSLIEKSGNANDYNYEDKVLSWTIDVNKAKHPISNAVLTDILPAGLGTITFEDITIEGAQVDSEDVTITRNDDGTQTVVINLGNIDDEVTVSYKTEVENFEVNDFKNTASLGGDGIGVGIPEAEDDATVNPPGNSFTKDFKGIDYNERTIDWELTVNPQREAITELKIEDTFPNNGMILLPETISVKIGGTELEEDTDYTLVPNTDGGETGYNKGFTINLINISEDSPLNEVLTVNFKTSYDPQLEVDGNTADDHTGDPTLYTNHAEFTGKTVNGNDFERDDGAETRVREDSWNSGKKEGQLVDFDEDGTERKIAWQVYTNYQQQNLGKGVSVTDTLDYEGTIDEDSIVVSVYEVDKDGNTTITDQTINDYSTEVNGKEFTLTFDEEFEVDERYVIEFTTSVPDISEKSYTNNAMLKVGEKEYPYTATVNYDRWDNFLDKQALDHTGNEVFIGEELEWEVTVNESLSIIKNATIKDTISAGLAYVEGSLEISTQSGTQLAEDTDYTFEVSETDEGETVLDIVFKEDVTEALTLNYTTVVTAEDGQSVNNKIELDGVGIEDKSKETSSLTAKQFSWVGGQYNPNRGALQVKKVDSNSGEVIESGEATFKLYYELNDEKVQFGEEFTTVNGILDVGNLPLRTYYLQEVGAPKGYVLSDKEIEIVVDKKYNNNQENIIEVNFENIAELDITVKKVWEDANNQDGERPGFITVKLLANGVETEKEVVLNTDNDWAAVFTGLSPVDKNGEEIVYTVEEVKVEGYDSVTTGTSADGFVITNTYEPEKINIDGTKAWDDANNQDGKRPESIRVNLLENGEKIDSIEVTAADDWKYTFTDLPKFKNGEEIPYTVQEDKVEDYSTVIDGFNITNSYTPDQTSINVVKAWEDGNNQDGIRSDSITVKLLADGEETGKEVELNGENNWQADFIELDVYANGEEIVYTVEEVKVEGYDSVTTGTSADGFVITNTHEPELINLDGTKTWNDANNQDGKRPESIRVNLLENGEKIDSVEVTAADDWKYTFTDLPKFKNGEEIPYTVQEDKVEDYSTVIDGFDITNSYTPDQTSINVVKAWDDENNQDGIRPESITVKLLAAGEETGKEIELTEENNWQASFTELDVYANGEEIVYTVEEVEVEGYDSVTTGTSADGFVITNTHEPELINLDGTKTWNDENNQDGQRPESIKVNLLANGTEVDSVEVTAEDEWKYTFTDLPKFKNGEEIPYTVQEDEVDGYDTEIDGLDITNSYTPEVLDVTVDKTWDDADNQDGKRPVSITVNLLANGKKVNTVEITADNDWTHTFKDLPKFAEGEEITYSVQELKVTDYSTEIDGFNITNSYTPGKTSVNVLKIWNDAENEADRRAESIEVVLLADGEATDQTLILNEANNWQADFSGLDEYKDGNLINYTVEEVAVDEYLTAITGDSETGFVITNTLKTYAIGDYTWIDKNKDGIQDEDEPVLPGVIVELYDESGENKLDETTTDENGLYIFDELPAGKYTVKFTLTEEQEKKYKFTKQNADETSTKDSDADPETGWTKVIELNDDNEHLTTNYEDQDVKATEGIDPTWDAGVIEKTYAIGDYTWIDKNKDGIQDEDEPVLPGVIVELYDEEGNKIDETTTDENGLYIFDELPAGKYKVKFTLTEEQKKKYKFTKQNADETSTKDSDADPETGWTKVIELNDDNEHLTTNYEDQDVKATEGIDPTWDAGVIEKTYAIGDYTWIDTNKDGIQDEDEPVLPGVIVELYDEDGKKIAETTTDENGLYIFDELPAGKYKIKFTLTKEQAKKYKFTKQNAGDDTTVDSDADPETGWTVEITLGDSNEYLTKDYTAQGFKATEGIDPTWDAGVVLKETPIDPSPEEPVDPEKPVVDDGDELPKTATNVFNILLLGGVLFLLGLLTLTLRGRRA